MGFYDLPKHKRAELVEQIKQEILSDIKSNTLVNTIIRFSDEDTYIRKSEYLSIGRIYLENEKLQTTIISVIKQLLNNELVNVRQTVINAAGEIGKTDFEVVQHFFEKGLFDKHHSIRNAVIGSIKKMGEKNPIPVLNWCRQYLHHSD